MMRIPRRSDNWTEWMKHRTMRKRRRALMTATPSQKKWTGGSSDFHVTLLSVMDGKSIPVQEPYHFERVLVFEQQPVGWTGDSRTVRILLVSCAQA